MDRVIIDRNKVWAEVTKGNIGQTLACSIIAQGRGRVHGYRRRVGQEIVEWNAERQADWIVRSLAGLKKWVPAVYTERKLVSPSRYEDIKLTLQDFAREKKAHPAGLEPATSNLIRVGALTD